MTNSHTARPAAQDLHRARPKKYPSIYVDHPNKVGDMGIDPGASVDLLEIKLEQGALDPLNPGVRVSR